MRADLISFQDSSKDLILDDVKQDWSHTVQFQDLMSLGQLYQDLFAENDLYSGFGHYDWAILAGQAGSNMESTPDEVIHGGDIGMSGSPHQDEGSTVDRPEPGSDPRSQASTVPSLDVFPRSRERHSRDCEISGRSVAVEAMKKVPVGGRVIFDK